jgi:hypothetical protein
MLPGLPNSGDLYERRKHEGKTKPVKLAASPPWRDGFSVQRMGSTSIARPEMQNLPILDGFRTLTLEFRQLTKLTLLMSNEPRVFAAGGQPAKEVARTPLGEQIRKAPPRKHQTK